MIALFDGSGMAWLTIFVTIGLITDRYYYREWLVHQREL